MKTIAILALLLLSACTTQPLAPDVWQLRCPFGGGSAVPFKTTESEVWFLTATHVVMKAPGPWMVISRHGEVITDGFVIAKHYRADVSIISFILPPSYPTISTNQIDFEPLLPGQEILSVGWGGGQLYWITEGVCSHSHRVSAPIVPGDSGGGVFDTDGKLRGIISGYGAAAHQSFIVPTHSIESWLKSFLTQ